MLYINFFRGFQRWLHFHLSDFCVILPSWQQSSDADMRLLKSFCIKCKHFSTFCYENPKSNLNWTIIQYFKILRCLYEIFLMNFIVSLNFFVCNFFFRYYHSPIVFIIIIRIILYVAIYHRSFSTPVWIEDYSSASSCASDVYYLHWDFGRNLCMNI